MQVELNKLKKCQESNLELIESLSKEDKAEYDSLNKELQDKRNSHKILLENFSSGKFKDATDSVLEMGKLETACLNLITHIMSFLKCKPDTDPEPRPQPQPKKPAILDKGARPGAVSIRPEVPTDFTFKFGKKKNKQNP